MKNLKNYTSEMPVEKSIKKIHRLLNESGAKDVHFTYTDMLCKSVKFMMPIKETTLVFSIDAKPDAVFKVMLSKYKNPSRVNKVKLKEQALRTCWKLIADWVEIQLSLVEIEQAEFTEAFFSNIYDMNTHQTFYQRVKDGGFMLLEMSNQKN